VSNTPVAGGDDIAPSFRAGAASDDDNQLQGADDKGRADEKGSGGDKGSGVGEKGSGAGEKGSGVGEKGSGAGEKGSGDGGEGGGGGGGGGGSDDVLNRINIFQNVNTEMRLSVQTYAQKLSTLIEQEQQVRHDNALQILQDKFESDLTRQKMLLTDMQGQLTDMQGQRDKALGENETLGKKYKELSLEYRAFFTRLEGMKPTWLSDADSDTTGNPAGGSAQ